MKQNLIDFLDDWGLEEGIQRFMFPKRQTFLCTLEELHLVETWLIYLSDKRKGAYIFCPEHHDFVNVSYENKVNQS